MSLPSNLRDTTELEQMTHEVRVSSTDAGAFQWQAGVFYSNIKRNYSQRAAHAGVRQPSWGDPVLQAGRRTKRFNGFSREETHRTTPN